MDTSLQTPIPQADAQNPALVVDFSWKSLKTTVTELGATTPLYTGDFKKTKPSIVFKTGDGSPLGTSTIHAVSIHADYTIHNRAGTLRALKKFKTAYTHLSPAYSDTETPMPMTWSSNCGFKNWDFVCLDANQNAVARFSSNVWAVKKLGVIEFLGPKASDREAREEIVVVGLTLYFTMLLRTNNFLNLVGAVFARTGPFEKAGIEGGKGVEGKEGKEREEVAWKEDDKLRKGGEVETSV